MTPDKYDDLAKTLIDKEYDLMRSNQKKRQLTFFISSFSIGCLTYFLVDPKSWLFSPEVMATIFGLLLGILIAGPIFDLFYSIDFDTPERRALVNYLKDLSDVPPATTKINLREVNIEIIQAFSGTRIVVKDIDLDKIYELTKEELIISIKKGKVFPEFRNKA